MHHQRGAEPYTLGQGGRRAVEVDFQAKHNYTKITTNTTGMHNIHAPTTYIRTVQSVYSPRPLTPEPVHAAHTDDGHRNRPVHGNNACARPTGPHQSPTLVPIGHVRQALQSTRTRTLHSTSLKGHAIFPGPRDTNNKHPSRTPIPCAPQIPQTRSASCVKSPRCS